jgi:Ca2+-binding EF-hand superfamily protein
VAAIRDAFPGASGSVRWRDLCARVDVPAGRPLPDPVAESRSGTLPPNMIDLLHKVSAVLADSEFRTLDPRRTGRISQQELAGVLVRLPVLLTPAEVRQLSGYYRVTGTRDINYLNLLRDARDIPAVPVRKAEDARAPPVIPPLPDGAHATLRRFKQFVTQHQMTPKDPFEQYDPALSGLVSVVRLQGLFKNIDFPISRAELDEVTGAFRDQRRPEYFACAAFAAAVEREDVASPSVRSSLESLPAMPRVGHVASAACAVIHDKLVVRNKRVAQAFAGLPAGPIPAGEFGRRIVDLGLILTPGEVQALIRKYQARPADDVDWQSFCKDVEASKTLSF